MYPHCPQKIPNFDKLLSKEGTEKPMVQNSVGTLMSCRIGVIVWFYSFGRLQVVKTHLRNMVIIPEMIGSIVGVYNGKSFNQVEIKVSARHFHTLFEEQIYRVSVISCLLRSTV